MIGVKRAILAIVRNTHNSRKILHYNATMKIFWIRSCNDDIFRRWIQNGPESAHRSGHTHSGEMLFLHCAVSIDRCLSNSIMRKLERCAPLHWVIVVIFLGWKSDANKWKMNCQAKLKLERNWSMQSRRRKRNHWRNINLTAKNSISILYTMWWAFV